MWPFRRKKKRQAPSEATSSPHTILGRVSTLLRANIHAAIDQAEDPEKMLDQLMRDYTAGIADTREAVGETIANVRLIEAQQAQDDEATREWEHKAQLAAARAKTLTKKGDTAGAQKAETLARKALNKQIAAEQRMESRYESIEQSNHVVESLKEGLQKMDERFDELKNHRSQLLSRYHLAQTQERVVGAVSQINSADPTSAISQLEEKIMRKEASAQGRLEVASNSIDNQFDELERNATAMEADSRLDALLGRDSHSSPAQIEKG